MTLEDRYAQRGVSLIEVLIAMVILAIGLLGLVGLQGRLQVMQMESYQRAQALMLMQDMASRVVLNRGNAAAYVTASPLGEGMVCPVLGGTPTRVERDLRDWCTALQGAAETIGGTNLGAMVGGRGCVESLGGDEYMVTVAWQGLAPVAAPPASVTCGEDLYDGGSNCINDLCRRVVTTIVRIATLT